MFEYHHYPSLSFSTAHYLNSLKSVTTAPLPFVTQLCLYILFPHPLATNTQSFSLSHVLPSSLFFSLYFSPSAFQLSLSILLSFSLILPLPLTLSLSLSLYLSVSLALFFYHLLSHCLNRFLSVFFLTLGLFLFLHYPLAPSPHPPMPFIILFLSSQSLLHSSPLSIFSPSCNSSCVCVSLFLFPSLSCSFSLSFISRIHIRLSHSFSYFLFFPLHPSLCLVDFLFSLLIGVSVHISTFRSIFPSV